MHPESSVIVGDQMVHAPRAVAMTSNGLRIQGKGKETLFVVFSARYE